MTIASEKKTLTESLTFLGNLIAFLNTSLDMEMDTDLYKNKIIDDLFFITNTLAKIEEIAANSSISEKEFLVLLKKVKILKDSVIILMENIIKYKYKQAIIFETQTNKIKSFISQYKISSAEIQKKLNKKQFSSQSENLVSKEELCFLFGQEAPG